jgi:hypothetical protein
MTTGYQIDNQHAVHFLTFQLVCWIDVFSRQRYRNIVIDSLKHCQKEKNLEVFAPRIDFCFFCPRQPFGARKPKNQPVSIKG